MSSFPWFQLKDPDSCYSPSLLIYPDRITHNIRKMCKMVGDPARLRPHIKTHKTAEIIRMQQVAGIEKFKCATFAEAELLGRCKAEDVLMAMQAVGPNINRYIDLCKSFPGTAFSTLVDNKVSIEQIAKAAQEEEWDVNIYLDLNVGMNRTGIDPGPEAKSLYTLVHDSERLSILGLHAYDGHLRNTDPSERARECNEVFAPVERMAEELVEEGFPQPVIIAGGSLSFPVHCEKEGIECSPGTTLLWDERNVLTLPDHDFLPAAVLFCRVISIPAEGLYCIDLGHKAVAPEMPFPRIKILGDENAKQLSQSEEHLVIKSEKTVEVGDVVYAIPMHICPTVAKYPKLKVVDDGEIRAEWRVAARDHVWEEKVRFKGRHRS